MSYDEDDAAYDAFVEKLYEEFRDSAVDDSELYDRIVENFRGARLEE